MAKQPDWTKEEDNFLRTSYATMKASEVAKCLGRTTVSIYSRAFTLQIHCPPRPHRNGWSDSDTEHLKRNYRKIPLQELATTLGRSLNAVKLRAAAVGVARKYDSERKWSDAEVSSLKEMSGINTFREMAAVVGRTESSVMQKCVELGIKSRHTKKPWDKQQEDFLRRGCKTMTYVEIAEAMGRTRMSVARRAIQIGSKAVDGKFDRVTVNAVRCHHGDGMNDVEIGKLVFAESRFPTQLAHYYRKRILGLPNNLQSASEYAAASGWPSDLRTIHVRCLNAMVMDDARTRTDIAKHSGLKRGTVAVALSQLRRRGAVIRLPRIFERQFVFVVSPSILQEAKSEKQNATATVG